MKMRPARLFFRTSSVRCRGSVRASSAAILRAKARTSSKSSRRIRVSVLRTWAPAPGCRGHQVVRMVMTTDRVTQVVNALGLSGTEASSRRPVRRTRRRYQRRYQFLVHGRGSPFHARYDLGLPRDISPWIKASATACSPPPEQRGCHGMRLRLGILEHGLLVWHGCATKADTRKTSLQPVRASTSHRTVESRESS